jgi:phosphoribosylglycinamide formyltransferase-1
MRVAVLASGNGSNLQALVDAEARGELGPATIALVLCNRPGAGALERARDAGIATELVDHVAFADRAAFEAAMTDRLGAHGIEAVVLAGFMRVLTDAFVRAWDGRILNTHPSLLPAFPGVRAPRQALEYGVKLTGCTIHLVDASLDGGPIISQAAVPVRDDDTEDSLHARILELEHQLLPAAVRALAEGRVERRGRRVTTR